MSTILSERENLHSRLLDAVRACQTHLGGKQEMVTEASSWVSCLCTQLEAVLQHRMKPVSRGGISVSSIRQAATGSNLEENTCWLFIRNHLTKHEVERYESLPNVTTDIGRGRAWIRCSLNEHSLDRYFHLLLSDFILLRKYYESDSFMLDEEKSSTLPQMAAGLGSIFFNIKYDDSALDGSARPTSTNSGSFVPNFINASTTLLNASNNLLGKNEKSPTNAALEAQVSEKAKKRTGKKKRAKIISFGDDEEEFNGAITPAERGGPGFVVINQSLIKSTASVTSESSSVDGNKNNAEQRIDENNCITFVEAAETSENLSTFSQSKVSESPTKRLDHQTASVITESLKNSSSPVQSVDGNPVASHSSSKNSTASRALDDDKFTPSPEIKKQTDQNTEEVGQVTRHLLSVRHHSALGSHDLIMDDWSMRSGSTSGLALPSENISTELFPVKDDYVSESSDSRSDLMASDHDATSASLVLSLAQKSTTEWQKSQPDTTALDEMDKETMNETELRQALVALMHRKNEMAEANRSMRTLLDSEMEHSAGLRRERENLQLSLKRHEEESATLQQQHIRENEVLRNQLKKYVGAVQALQRGEPSPELPSDVTRVANDASPETSESEVYEKKLIEVAEMHGELMEFNERLHVRLQSALSLLRSMKAELVDLRGPMPNDELVGRIERDNISGSADYSPPMSRALINIWIPSSFVKGKGANKHHVYQVYIRISDEEWNVYRRYSHFHELHRQLRKKYPVLDTFGLPPKKVMGNKGKKFVEDRRKGLQIYLRLVMNNIVQNHEKIVAKPNKETLMKLLPFFSETLDIPDQTPNQAKKSERKRGEQS